MPLHYSFCMICTWIEICNKQVGFPHQLRLATVQPSMWHGINSVESIKYCVRNPTCNSTCIFNRQSLESFWSLLIPDLISWLNWLQLLQWSLITMQVVIHIFYYAASYMIIKLSTDFAFWFPLVMLLWYLALCHTLHVTMYYIASLQMVDRNFLALVKCMNTILFIACFYIPSLHPWTHPCLIPIP